MSGEGGAQRPVLRVNEPKRRVRAPQRAQNPLVIYISLVTVYTAIIQFS
jgi:hypothetical protein